MVELEHDSNSAVSVVALPTRKAPARSPQAWLEVLLRRMGNSASASRSRSRTQGVGLGALALPKYATLYRDCSFGENRIGCALVRRVGAKQGHHLRKHQHALQ